MSDEQVDKSKRRFLVISTSVVGGIGVAGSAVPFVASMLPSEKAKAAGAPIDVDISKLEMGQKIDVEWRGKVVWVIRRTPEMLESIKKLNSVVEDPNSDLESQQPPYAKNQFRSRPEHPEILVLVGICTHLGCSPTFRKEIAPADLGPSWIGGFFCPCHQSKFDLAGRVFKGMPAPKNLEVPRHTYLSDATIRVGEDTKTA